MLVFLTKTVNKVDKSGSTLSAEKRKVQRGQDVASSLLKHLI